MESESHAVPKTTLRVRVATAADIPRLIALITAAFAIETFLEGTRTDEARLADMMRSGEILVGEDASGLIVCSVYTERRGNRGYLGMLAVDPAHQTRGLALLLVKAVEDRFRALGLIAIDITVLSLRAELPRIYRRYGYVETGIEPCHLTQAFKPDAECHSIVMSKQL